MEINDVKGGDIMKKYLKVIGIIFVSLFMITGCSTYKSYTYEVDTGDKITVRLDISNGYDISYELPFSIYDNDELLSQATFISLSGYNQYIGVINSDSSVRIIDSGSENGITYTFYSYNDSEFNYLIRVDGSSTGLLLGNPISEESARECFNRLTITKE